MHVYATSILELGITDLMAPVEKIDNLLISTRENCVQDRCSLLAFFKLFNKHLTTGNVQHLAIVLFDGHSSKFDVDILTFFVR